MYGGGYIGGEETLQANQDDPIALAEFEARIAQAEQARMSVPVAFPKASTHV